jgi:DNA-binding MarR family transcriptional regulator
MAQEPADSLHAAVQGENVGSHLIELYDVYVRFLRMRSHSKLMNLNLTQWRTLTFIRFNPGRTQRVLSTAVGIDPSSMTPIVDFFEAKGWVKRHKSSANRSAYGLRMTAAGLKAYRQIEREIGHLEKVFETILGSGERNKLVTLLAQLREKLAHDLAQSPA